LYQYPPNEVEHSHLWPNLLPAGKIPTSAKRLRFEHFTPMGIISAIIIGLIVGAIAKFLMPGKDPGGWIITILIGVTGSFIGTYLGQAIGLYRTGEPAGFIGSIVGAVILLLLYRPVVKRRAWYGHWAIRNEELKCLIVLEADDLEALYGRPRFTHEERVQYLSPKERALLDHFILQLGYFKARRMFFIFHLKEVTRTSVRTWPIFSWFPRRLSNDCQRYAAETTRLILELCNCRSWKAGAQKKLDAKGPYH
jgi:uncharacterized membrane protein YeaQ/YmgE (transglycosylase-associated protein family)